MKRISYFFIPFFILSIILSCSQDQSITKNIEVSLYAPTFIPLGGEFYESVNVEIKANTIPSKYSTNKSIKIAYTTDGTDPIVNKDGTIVNGQLYISPLTIDRFTILKAVCFVKEDGVVSNIGRSAYSFKAAYPIFTPSTGKYGLDQTVKIESSTEGSIIYYTTDGTSPSQSSNIYVTPLTISKPVTIKAVAYRFGWAYSETKEATFSFKPDTPNIYPNGGIFDTPVDVTLSPSLMGCDIRYTVDDSTPDDSSTSYSGPVTINSSKNIKAIAIKTGMENSEVAVASFSI
ncbi:MAG TPA: chitobiase/beta-hexosaminidase C-terminal domain-containing protein, partial [Spirochaetota bacterium]|nr:chitobiase/beta-hexosaminidase C-terminal domain-containing protein [Spirochaetota bacterium]